MGWWTIVSIYGGMFVLQGAAICCTGLWPALRAIGFRLGLSEVEWHSRDFSLSRVVCRTIAGGFVILAGVLWLRVGKRPTGRVSNTLAGACALLASLALCFTLPWPVIPDGPE